MYISIFENSQLPAEWVLGDFNPGIKRPECEIEPSAHLVLRSNYVELNLHFEIGLQSVILNKANEQFYL
jgi:hypothetical protein